MKNRKIKVNRTISVLLMSCIASIQGWSATYFVDCLLGDDTNDGLSTESVWKTIDKINATLLSPKDNVRFKANQRT